MVHHLLNGNKFAVESGVYYDSRATGLIFIELYILILYLWLHVYTQFKQIQNMIARQIFKIISL